MGQAIKDEQKRARVREFEARLVAARRVIEVLCLFVAAREATGNGGASEVAFAMTPTATDEPSLPAAVWVAMRHGDADAVLDCLAGHSAEEFVVAEHEQLNDHYRLTTVPESRQLPRVEPAVVQVAAFLDLPADVLAMVASWGPDDPRTAAEVDRLLAPRPSASRDAEARTESTRTRPTLGVTADELGTLLCLTDEQRAALGTLVRQADVVVGAPSRV